MKDFKKCKGTGKALGYGCGEMVPVSRYGKTNRVYGLGKSCGCYMDWLLNSEEGKKKIEQASLKVTEPRRSLEKAIEDKKSRGGIQREITKTKELVHKAIRLRDEGKRCITCGCEWRSDFDAGHCFPTKFNSIRFHFDNIHGQCIGCNRFKDGRHSEYIIQLPKRIGEEAFKNLKELAELDRKFVKKWTREELSEIRKEAKEIIKQFKN
jgi:hypothetical protein